MYNNDAAKILCLVTTVCIISGVTNPITAGSSESLANNKNVTTKSSEIIMEGGGTISKSSISSTVQPMGREHIIIVTTSTTVGPLPVVTVASATGAKNVTNSTTNSSETKTILTVNPLPNKTLDGDDGKVHSDIVARKGVVYTEATTPKTTSATTAKVIKMKPTITEGSDDEPFAPSNFDPIKPNVKSPNLSTTDFHKTVDNSDDIVGADVVKTKPDFVVAIVLVILAVPLVAILISVIYKRGAEWWQHRHYRRMDFLIDGIYNN